MQSLMWEELLSFQRGLLNEDFSLVVSAQKLKEEREMGSQIWKRGQDSGAEA